jgi:TonB-dependent starch-binding outer membrane protein SusC
MKQKVRNLIRLGYLLCFLLGINNAFAQEGVVTGTVADEADGSTMPGVSILVKGTSTGAITDIDGKFKVKISQKSTLVVSFIGYTSKEVEVEAGANVDIKLKVEARSLDEVVVIGYGTTKKKDATGSVIAVSSESFNRGAISSPQDLLVGKSAGVVITSSNGAPGAGSTIRIRGGSSMSASNDPLIVIDGVPIDNSGITGMANPLSSINPNDIETFTILKDASAAAIYGSRASNGVIIITTKKGKGGKMKISYNGNVSVRKAPNYVDVLSGDQFRALAFDKIGTNNITAESLSKLGNTSTNWQDEIYTTSVSHDHNVSVLGTMKKVPYRASIGYTDENGIVTNTGLQRTTGSISAEPLLLDDHLKVNINLKGTYTRSNFGNSGAVGSSVLYDPTKPVTNGNTRYGGYTTWTLDNTINGNNNQMATSNPVAQVDLTNDNSDAYRLIGNVQLDYKFKFLPDLHANLNLGTDRTSSDGTIKVDTIATWTRRGQFGSDNKYSQDKKNDVIDFYFNYVKEMSNISSKIDFMAGYSWQHFWRQGESMNRSIVDLKNPNVSAQKLISDTTSYETENYLVSFFGRLNYTFKGRYLFTANLRRDGSSRFSEDNRWGMFPSLALAWNIKEEPIFASINKMDALKLRLGWGITGQQDITSDDYPYLGTYTVAEKNAYYQFGNTWVPTLRPKAYDPNIKWEETTTQNIGLDFSFFKERISGSVDLYKRVTDDLINDIFIPNGSNFSNHLLTNVGSLENKGVEVSLNIRPITTKDMSWDFGVNLTYNKNEITKLTRTDDPTYIGVQTGGISGGTGNNILINSVGYSINTFFALQQVYNEKGMPVEGLFVNRSGEKTNVSGNLNNFYRYKKAAPDYLIGLSTKFRYQNFDVAASARISLGNYVYNNIASQTFYGNLFNNNYWQNLTTHIYKSEFNSAQYLSDFYIENASYFKLDNLSLGYNFNSVFGNNVSGRISFVMQNVFTITDYSGLDPEVDGGIDNNFYPRARTFLLGINLNF